MATYLVHAANGEHYVGSCRDDLLWARFAQHVARPSSMFKRWKALGVPWGYARVWLGRGQDTEEAIKAYKKHRAFCPAKACSGRKARGTRGLRYPRGAYWIARARMHGKGLSPRTIHVHQRLRREGKVIPARPWAPRAEHLADGHDCPGIRVQVGDGAWQYGLDLDAAVVA